MAYKKTIIRKGGKYVLDDTDKYWETLVHWGDILGKRYNNKIANYVIMDYLDGQSRRALNKIPTA